MYIDDLLVRLQVPRRQANRPDDDTELSVAASSAYVAAGSQKPSIRPMTRLGFKAWGAELDGDAGKVWVPKTFRPETWRLVSLNIMV